MQTCEALSLVLVLGFRLGMGTINVIEIPTVRATVWVSIGRTLEALARCPFGLGRLLNIISVL
jgi:hypothetical protein